MTVLQTTRTIQSKPRLRAAPKVSRDGSVRDFAGAQPRAGQKKCERGRESAAPGKSKQAPADAGYRRLRRVFGRERSKQPGKAGGFSTPSAGYTRLMLQIVAQPGVGR